MDRTSRISGLGLYVCTQTRQQTETSAGDRAATPKGRVGMNFKLIVTSIHSGLLKK
jgi:hypothetical protein